MVDVKSAWARVVRCTSTADHSRPRLKKKSNLESSRTLPFLEHVKLFGANLGMLGQFQSNLEHFRAFCSNFGAIGSNLRAFWRNFREFEAI